ncbi:MAG: translation initiation factor IF-6 [Nitrososphaerales archaeon]
MSIFKFDVYRNSNVGVYLRANEDFILVPMGLARSKIVKLEANLEVRALTTSVGGSRLLGPMLAMNSHGIILSKIASDQEVKDLRKHTGLEVERIDMKYTSVGNLVCANDNGALVSRIVPTLIAHKISDILDVPVESLGLGNYYQVGAMILATNSGGVIHPLAGDREIDIVKDLLKVEVEAGTVNSGVPFVTSGIIANARHAIVGSHTSGLELAILSRALKI